MRKLIAKDLKIKFIETLNEIEEFSYEEGNPFLISIGFTKFFVFLKNLSPAFLKNIDITRVQLPHIENFEHIYKTGIPLIVLGYDVSNDIIVCWDPSKIKVRLNIKDNISLYSRLSLQKQATDNHFSFGQLSNGERILFFKRKNLIYFFDRALDIFQESQSSIYIPIDTNKQIEKKTTNVLTDITDKVLIDIINPLLENNKVLQAVELTAKYYGNDYRSMKFRDWYKLVNELYKKNRSH